MASQSSKGLNVACWILQILLAAVYLFAGVAKFVGSSQMVVLYERIGYGQWFRYLTGILEVIGAIGLLVPRYAFYGAVLLAIVMVGAVYFEVASIGESPAPPLVMLVLVGAVAWLRRPR